MHPCQRCTYARYIGPIRQNGQERTLLSATVLAILFHSHCASGCACACCHKGCGNNLLIIHRDGAVMAIIYMYIASLAIGPEQHTIFILFYTKNSVTLHHATTLWLHQYTCTCTCTCIYMYMYIIYPFYIYMTCTYNLCVP